MVFAIARVAAADGGRDQEQGEDSQKLEHDGSMDGGKNHWPLERKSRGSFGVAGIRHRVDAGIVTGGTHATHSGTRHGVLMRMCECECVSV